LLIIINNQRWHREYQCRLRRRQLRSEKQIYEILMNDNLMMLRYMSKREERKKERISAQVMRMRMRRPEGAVRKRRAPAQGSPSSVGFSIYSSRAVWL
jgi:hypothetical protein